MKFHRQWCWAEWFGTQLAEALPVPTGAGRSNPPLVVPVPMPWRRRWWRGFNQSALLAQRVGTLRNWEVCEVLHRLHHTPPQTRVAYDDRHRNVADSFGTAPIDLGKRPVVLIDDVRTSGSTLTACAQLLKDANAGPIYVGVIAVAEKHDHDDANELDA
jgi:ComF family protein